jgi:hypothetical protein
VTSVVTTARAKRLAGLLVGAVTLISVASACKNDRVAVLLVDHACRCDYQSLRLVAGLRVILEGLESRSTSCIKPPAQPQRLATLQQALQPSTVLSDLGEGTYALTVVGYEDGACAEGVVTCGHTGFSLPSSTAALDVPMRCQRDSSGGPTTISEQACLKQTISPERCTGSGDDASVGDAGTLELTAIDLVDDGSCSSSRLDHVDSLAVALYSTGKALLSRKCLPLSNTPQDLADILSGLPKPLLSQLNAGQYLLMVTGHDNNNCSTDDVIACGGAAITLPLATAPKITMKCYSQYNCIDEATCLNSL